MTPDRLALLQRLLRNLSVDWGVETVAYAREPVEFRRRWPPYENVVDLPAIQKIRFERHLATVAITDLSGVPTTTPAMVSWIEAEGVVITAWALHEEGDPVAEELIGMDSPLQNRVTQPRRRRR